MRFFFFRLSGNWPYPLHPCKKQSYTGSGQNLSLFQLNIDPLTLAGIQTAFNYELNDWIYSFLQQCLVFSRRWQRNGCWMEPHGPRYNSHERDVTSEVGVFQLWGIRPTTPRTLVALICAWNNYWSSLTVLKALLRCPIACHAPLACYRKDLQLGCSPGEHYSKQDIENTFGYRKPKYRQLSKWIDSLHNDTVLQLHCFGVCSRPAHLALLLWALRACSVAGHRPSQGPGHTPGRKRAFGFSEASMLRFIFWE